MNTLISNRYPVGPAHSMMLFKSELVGLNTVCKVKNTEIDKFLHEQNIHVIRTYLNGYLFSRITAYEKKGYYYSERVQKLKNLLHHVTSFRVTSPVKFYLFILKWESLLLNSLPVKENKSHEKIQAIIDSCNKHSMPF